MRKTEELRKELESVTRERDAAMAHAEATEKKLADLKAEAKKAEAHQKMFDEMYESAVLLKGAHDSFIKAGFDEEQAFEILLNMLISAQAQVQVQAPTVRSLLDLPLN